MDVRLRVPKPGGTSGNPSLNEPFLAEELSCRPVPASPRDEHTLAPHWYPRLERPKLMRAFSPWPLSPRPPCPASVLLWLVFRIRLPFAAKRSHAPRTPSESLLL